MTYTFSDIATILFETAILFVVSTILFDVLHYLLHKWQKSRFAILRTFSKWHDYHHKFLDETLTIQKSWNRKNIIFHILPEYLTSIAGVCLGLLIFSPAVVILNIVLHTIMVIFRLVDEGMDINHKNVDRLDARKSMMFVNPSYHFLHHIYPQQYFSSFVGIFDFILGSSCQIKGQKFVVTGASGAFGQAIVEKIKAAGGHVTTVKYGQDFTYDDYSIFEKLLPETDVLILSHGSKITDAMQANCTSFQKIIDLYIAVTQERLVPPEVWALGSEIEIHGDFGMDDLKAYSASKKAYAKIAKSYYRSRDVIYRHIVPSAFTSQMGKGLISATCATNWALFYIKRGFYYIPVTYTGLAYLNYFRFRFL